LPAATLPKPRTRKIAPKKKTASKRWISPRLLYWLLTAVIAFYTVIAAMLVLLRFVNPPFTAVQLERHLDASFHHRAYQKHYHFVALAAIAPNMRRAAIAAEDTRFFQHHGFDWKQMGQAVEQDLGEGRKRGASTITQQLDRNLFLSTSPNLIRKAFELSIVPLTELILSKNRILELYLNVIEWGPGIYGCDAAARRYYGISAANLSREQAINLAEVLPAPLHWKPGQKPAYGARIDTRMRQLGW
jgi:monofunctional biosynthetic peptidoglycan transglycosylase